MAADSEATVTVLSVSPVSFHKVAESEARKMEPLSSMVTCEALAAWLPFKVEEAEGREVLMVSLTLPSVAASTWRGVKRRSKKKAISGKNNGNNTFFTKTLSKALDPLIIKYCLIKDGCQYLFLTTSNVVFKTVSNN